jgi:hypothetical protein
MIKIIKPGQKTFIGFCERCGCEFTYELNDLKLSATGNKVSCPTCSKDYIHPTKTQDLQPSILKGFGDLSWPPDPTPTNIDPCAGCSWRAELLVKGSYIGDTPCDYCNKNPYKTTCLQTSISTTDCSKAVYGTVEAFSADRTSYSDNQTDSSCQVVGSTYTLHNNGKE